MVGIGLGSQLTSVSAESLIPTLHVLHGLSAASFLALGAVCALMLARGRQAFTTAPDLMLCAIACLGASLMGMLPVVLQLAISRVQATENVTSGLVYMVAMVIAASLTSPVAELSGGRDWLLVGLLLAAELVMYCLVVPTAPNAANASCLRLATKGKEIDLY